MKLRFDYNNMMTDAIGEKGVCPCPFGTLGGRAHTALGEVKSVRQKPRLGNFTGIIPLAASGIHNNAVLGHVLAQQRHNALGKGQVMPAVKKARTRGNQRGIIASARRLSGGKVDVALSGKIKAVALCAIAKKATALFGCISAAHGATQTIIPPHKILKKAPRFARGAKLYFIVAQAPRKSNKFSLFLLFFYQGQFKPELTAHTHGAFNAILRSVRLQNTLDDREPEARADHGTVVHLIHTIVAIPDVV